MGPPIASCILKARSQPPDVPSKGRGEAPFRSIGLRPAQLIPVDVRGANFYYDESGAKALAGGNILSRRQNGPSRRLRLAKAAVLAHTGATASIALSAQHPIGFTVQTLHIGTCSVRSEVVNDEKDILGREGEPLERVPRRGP